MNSTENGLNLYFNSYELVVLSESVSKLFLPKDIATNLEVDFFMLKIAMLDEDGPIYKEFHKSLISLENKFMDSLLNSEIDAEEYAKRIDILNDYKIKAQIQLSI